MGDLRLVGDSENNRWKSEKLDARECLSYPYVGSVTFVVFGTYSVLATLNMEKGSCNRMEGRPLATGTHSARCCWEKDKIAN